MHPVYLFIVSRYSLPPFNRGYNIDLVSFIAELTHKVTIDSMGVHFFEGGHGEEDNVHGLKMKNVPVIIILGKIQSSVDSSFPFNSCNSVKTKRMDQVDKRREADEPIAIRKQRFHLGINIHIITNSFNDDIFKEA